MKFRQAIFPNPEKKIKIKWCNWRNRSLSSSFNTVTSSLLLSEFFPGSQIVHLSPKHQSLNEKFQHEQSMSLLHWKRSVPAFVKVSIDNLFHNLESWILRPNSFHRRTTKWEKKTPHLPSTNCSLWFRGEVGGMFPQKLILVRKLFFKMCRLTSDLSLKKFISTNTSFQRALFYFLRDNAIIFLTIKSFV